MPQRVAASEDARVNIRYLGFRSTARGREYSLRVIDGLATRLFVLVITHQDFASQRARFQDAPDLCFTKLERDLEENPDLVPQAPSVLTTQDFAAYHKARLQPASVKRRRPRD